MQAKAVLILRNISTGKKAYSITEVSLKSTEVPLNFENL